MTTTLTIETTKPRNPFAMPARRRAAGAHRAGDRRQQLRQALRRELDDTLVHPRHASP